jgi:hypothetical protein
MVNADSLGARVQRWADGESAVAALVLIGSRARTAGDPLAADAFSDWDFQVVTSQPARFNSRAWLLAAGLDEPLAYVTRPGRLGTATKVSAVLRDGELDVVVLPASRLRLAKWFLRLGLATRVPTVRHGLGGLATVLRGGYKIVIGEREWGAFFRRVATEIPLPRLNNAAVRALAEGFVCDFVSTRQKIARGELLAAQRWLHLQLAEANFQLLHELRQRRGEPTLPDVRRVEQLPVDSRGIVVSAIPSAEGLQAAIEKSAETLRELMVALVPDWRWPL